MSSLRRLRALSAHLGGPATAPPLTPGNTKAVATVGSGMVIESVERSTYCAPAARASCS